GRMQALVENIEVSNNPSIEDTAKIKYLSAIYQLVHKYNLSMNVDPAFYRRLVGNLRELIIAAHENRLDAYARANANIYTLENSEKMLEDLPATRGYIYGEVARQMPARMIKKLDEYADEPFACNVISA